MRRLSQRAIELRAFQRLLDRARIDLRGAHLLDASCGNGFGLELLAKAFRPARLVGLDGAPAQIERATERARRRGITAELAVGELTSIAQPDGAFAGAFVFGPLHHIVEWRAALVELARVLAPGGVLLIEEAHEAGESERHDPPRALSTRLPVPKASTASLAQALANAQLAIVGEQKLAGRAITSFAVVKR